MYAIIGQPKLSNVKEDNPHFVGVPRLILHEPIPTCIETAGFDCRADGRPTWKYCDAHLGPFTHMATYRDSQGYAEAVYFRQSDGSWSLGAN